MRDSEHPNPELVKQRIGALQEAIARALDGFPPRLDEAFTAFVHYRDAVIDVFDDLPEHHIDRYAKTAHRLATEIEANRDAMESPTTAAVQLYTWAAKAYRRLHDLAPTGSVTAKIYLRQAQSEEDRAMLAPSYADARLDRAP